MSKDVNLNDEKDNKNQGPQLSSLADEDNNRLKHIVFKNSQVERKKKLFEIMGDFENLSYTKDILQPSLFEREEEEKPTKKKDAKDQKGQSGGNSKGGGSRDGKGKLPPLIERRRGVGENSNKFIQAVKAMGNADG